MPCLGEPRGTHCFFVVTEKKIPSALLTPFGSVTPWTQLVDAHQTPSVHHHQGKHPPNLQRIGTFLTSGWRKKSSTDRETSSLKYFLNNPLLIGGGTRVLLDSFKTSA